MSQSFRKELQCNLNNDELNVYRDELARLTTEEIEIEAAKKEAVSEFGAKLQNGCGHVHDWQHTGTDKDGTSFFRCICGLEVES
jgi:hypothetical protein